MAEADQHISRKLSTAAALLGKAQSTTFPAEQESLALGAYSQLAAFLNALDPPEPSGAGRRERRLLADRRRPLPQPVPEMPAGGGEESPAVIDLRGDDNPALPARVGSAAPADRAISVYRPPDRPGRGRRIDLSL